MTFREGFHNPEQGARAVPFFDGAAAREVRESVGRNYAVAGAGGLSSEIARGEQNERGFTGFSFNNGETITNYDPTQRQDRLASLQVRTAPDGSVQTERRFDGNPRGLVSEVTAKDRAGNVRVTESFQDGRRVETVRRSDGTENVRSFDREGNEVPNRTSTTPGGNDRTSQTQARPDGTPAVGSDRRAARAENGRVQGGSEETAEGERRGRGGRRGRGNHDGSGRERGQGREREQGQGRGQRQRRRGAEGQQRSRGRHSSDQQRERRQQNDGDGQPRRNERNPRRFQSRLNNQNPNEIFRIKKMNNPVAKPESPDETSAA